MVHIWDTKEKIVNEAKKYTSVTEFQKGSGGAFNAARRLGIMDEFTWFEKKERLPFGYWKDKEHCMEEAKKYTSKKEFQNKNQSAYWASLKYEYLDEMPWLAKRKSTPRNILNNKDLVMEESKKYSSRVEFMKNNRSFYSAALRNGWLDEMLWLGEKTQKVRGHWENKENVLKEAMKYASRDEFKKESSGAYKAAHKHRWIDEMTWLKSKNEKGSEHKKRRWKTKDDVIEESKKYNSRSEFKKRSGKAYEIARKNRWLDEMVWLNNKNVYIDKVDCVYKYYFPAKHAIYVGRTIYTELRDYQHRNVVNDSVFKFAMENGFEIPKMEIIETNLTVLQGAEKEKYWEQYYRDMGYTIINKKPCGSIGSMAAGKWSKKKCFEESKKYKTRSEFFEKSSSAYQKALKEGWLNEMTWLYTKRKYPRGYWTVKENVINEGKKYKSKKEFGEKNISAFLAAYKYGFIKEMDWLTKQKQHPFGYWNNKENIIEESKKYKTMSEFRKKSCVAYNSAKKNELLNEMTWLKKPRREKVIKSDNDKNDRHPKGYWKNRENMMKEAKKYSSKEEFQKGNLYAFLAAHKYGYIDEMDWMVKQKQHKNGYWNYEHIEEEAMKYNTKTEFSKGCNTAYRAALKMGIINDFFAFNDYVE
jgi:hypothetical protein